MKLLGVFYLGKKVDPDSGEMQNEYLLYDSADLTTHAVCVGMTGSGKTGLCVSILEEAAIDNIPSIIIDPKGDLGNLLLAFPKFRKEDFLPWVNPDEAKKKNITPESFAEKQAALWKKGLSDWDQDGERIRRYKESSEFTIYTPGSTAGVPVSIVDSLSAPKGQKLEDFDLLRERIQTTVSGLLGLLGVDADPLQSREHILLSNIIEQSWTAGRDLKLGDLIRSIQSPPMQQIGVFNIEDFFPANARTKLAMTFNNLLAAPTFKTWLEGQPLDIDNILYTKDGKPCTAIFSIAHLSDSERMFFVTLLLNQVIGWMRTRTGSTSLRALLYMDEVFGFLPPVGEPPSKKPFLTLLKQARAFGLGVILSTQNPVDLDYKGLSNAGTWFIGRLQTERDKERLVDGLIRGNAGDTFDKKTLMGTISSLNKRQFLLHNVHEKRPELFNTRWVLSYLCGPLTRLQISKLKKEETAGEPILSKQEYLVTEEASSQKQTILPQLPPGIRHYFAEIEPEGVTSERVQYHPYLLAAADISFINSRYAVSHTETVSRAIPLSDTAKTISWIDSLNISYKNELIGGSRDEGASFLSPSPMTSRLTFFEKLDKKFESYLYQSFKLTLLQNKALKLTSQPGESRRDFTIRLRDASHQKRELEKERLKKSFEKKVQSIEKKINAAENVISRENEQYQERLMDTAISVGSTLLGAFLGGRSARSGMTRAARSASRIRKDKADIERARAKKVQLNNEIAALNKDFEGQLVEIAQKYDSMIETVQEIPLRPKKADIVQSFFAVIWIPFQKDQSGQQQALNSLFK
jgi:hypothetical protein